MTATIPLGQPVGVCQDIDWHQDTQRVYVGCTNGLVLAVDPVLLTVVTLVNNPGANYSVICADHWSPGTVGWGYDANAGWLDQFLVGGVVVPAAPLATNTVVELAEKRIDPAAPLPENIFRLKAAARV